MKFCECGSLFDLYDNIDERKLYYHCVKCNLQVPFDGKIVLSKNVIKVKNLWKKYDKTLPSSDKHCYHCKQTSVFYEKRSDLTLTYICSICNEEWS